MFNSTCHIEVLQAVAYAPLFAAGLVLNVAALWAFVARRHSWKDTHIYMLNLAVADLTLIVFLPFRIIDACHCLLKTRLCTFLISMHYVNMYASILTSTAISVHRFLLVRFPVESKGWRWKKRKALAVCLSIWALIITLCVSYSEANSSDKLTTCYERKETELLRVDFLALLVVVGFLVPLAIIVCCSSQTIVILWREKDNSAEKKSIVGIVTANMIVFIFCYTPIHMSLLLKYSVQLQSPVVHIVHRVLLVSEWIATTNCCLDSISYYFLLKSLYSSARRKRDEVAMSSNVC
ncbi:hypothetical protein CRUP_011162 [Coryphaenoides rupestris]|nr:hypothetical protein CRUP_011162 [Coryphaenoides rupestris]